MSLLAALSYRQLDLDSTAPTPVCRPTRTTAEIVWSCLSMIILCTYTSVRPNVPSVPRSGHEALVYWDKAKIFFITLIAPELIVLWSIRQFFAARKMAKAYRDYGWTMTHALFAIMGGFALYDSEGNFLFHLWDERFCEHFREAIDDGEWDGFRKQQQKLEELLPHGRDQSYSSLLEYCVANKIITMTEDEIRNLGHADLLAKTITILQTLYFIANCMARGVSRLAITELEFFTLGFAALNLMSYSFWWYKPLGVRYPVRVMDRPKPISPSHLSISQNQHEATNCRLLGTAPPVASRAPGIFRAFSDRIWDDHANDWDAWPLLDRMVGLLILPIAALGKSFEYAARADRASKPQPERGNIFSGATSDEHPLTHLLTYFIAVILGVFHCIPIMLNYRDFPGHTKDHHLWTAFAIWTTVLPLGMIMIFLLLGGLLEVSSENQVLKQIVFITVILLALSPILSYSAARFALMALAAKQLTDLPPSALQQVEWTTLIPHFGV
ncbi:hypothetical protein PM082_017586 [Marasmius tenuissimus]|nr:hypothetical protein PM082_017586 [Marasmius tenuissimus]